MSDIHQELINESRTIQRIEQMRAIAYNLLSWRMSPPSSAISRSKIRRAIRTGALRRITDFDIVRLLDIEIRRGLGKRADFQQIKTTYEREWLARLQQLLDRLISAACWIGPFCIDLFIVDVDGDLSISETRKKSSGLAIEIDGWIHHRIPKQKKDDLRERYLQGLGIPVVHFENNEICEEHFRKAFRKLEGLKSISHARRLRLVRRIQVERVLAWASPEELNSIFGPEFFHLTMMGHLNLRRKQMQGSPEEVL